MRIEANAWMTAPATRAVIAALQGDAHAPLVRFVGGCVRNALAGRPIIDIDLATPLEPQAVQARLAAADIKAIPTGIDHGTVTAVAGPDRQPFEVTTLRRDVATDGRRAVVAFTDDWREDAARRDLTINAMFADPDGTVHDYFGGVADLAAGRIRFVGPAALRIEEDYLRILRFFRFYADFGAAPPDPEALAACRQLAPGMDKLSGERVAKEMFALLATADPAPTVQLMADHHVLPRIDRHLVRSDRLAALMAIEPLAKVATDPVLRLGALTDSSPDAADSLVARLRPSNAMAARLRALVGPLVDPGAVTAPQDVRRFAYRLGVRAVIDQVLLGWAEQAAAVAAADNVDLTAAAQATAASAWPSMLAAVKDWQLPRFPLRGADAVALGVSPGREVGAYLSAVETWWMDGEFAADRPACLAELQRRVASGDPGG